MQWQSFLWVGIGGFCGANARFLLTTLVNQRFPRLTGSGVSVGTAFVNVTGSFLLALLLTYISKRAAIPESISLLIGTGFFGAYTTFSTYANESIVLINDGQWITGLAYILITNALCLLGVVLGIAIAQRIF